MIRFIFGMTIGLFLYDYVEGNQEIRSYFEKPLLEKEHICKIPDDVLAEAALFRSCLKSLGEAEKRCGK